MSTNMGMKRDDGMFNGWGLVLLFMFFSFWLGAQEGLRINWPDEYQWKVITRLNNEEVSLLEIIPGDETDSTWTLLGQMLVVKGVVKAKITLAMEVVMESILEETPDAYATVIQSDSSGLYPWILFKVENIHLPGRIGTMSKLYYIKQGQTALFVNFVAIKEKKITDKAVSRWGDVFLSSEIIDYAVEKQKKREMDKKN